MRNGSWIWSLVIYAVYIGTSREAQRKMLLSLSSVIPDAWKDDDMLLRPLLLLQPETIEWKSQSWVTSSLCDVSTTELILTGWGGLWSRARGFSGHVCCHTVIACKHWPCYKTYIHSHMYWGNSVKAPWGSQIGGKWLVSGRTGFT